MEVASLPFLVANADAVGDGQSGGVRLVPDVQQLELVEQRSPGRNIWLPERGTKTRASAGPSAPQRDGFPGTLLRAPSLAGEVHVHAADRVCVSASAASRERVFFVVFCFFKGLERRGIDLERKFLRFGQKQNPFLVIGKAHALLLLESVEIRGEVTLKR